MNDGNQEKQKNGSEEMACGMKWKKRKTCLDSLLFQTANVNAVINWMLKSKILFFKILKH